VSHPITNGESWQLGVYLAHALHANGNLALQGEPADQIWMVTGAVNAREETTKHVDHIQEKLDVAAEILKQCKQSGTKVAYLLPKDNLPDLKDAYGLDFIAIDDIKEALNNPQVITGGKSKAPKFVAGLLLSVALIGGAYAYQAGFAQAGIERAINYIADLLNKGDDVQKLPVASEVEQDNLDQVSNSEDEAENAVVVDSAPVAAPVAQPIQEEPVKTGSVLAPENDGELSAQPKSSIGFAIYALVAEDGGSCAGRKYRDAGLKPVLLQSYEDPSQEIQDQKTYCSLRADFKNNLSEVLNVSMASSLDRPEIVKPSDRLLSARRVELAPGENFQQDFGLSLYRSGSFKIDMVLQANHFVSNFDILIKGLDENATSKFQ
ncbi:MAG: hypothetical protein R3261_08490, partial [Alphaproteobacteria bacterium]|nr:hypothetical protein [Alphaproteobacteria bacterium]